MTQTKCILCPIDFSDFSRHALDSAVRFSRGKRRRIVALHVLARWPAALYEMPGFDIANYRNEAVTKGRDRLAALIPERGVRALDVVVSEGRPDQQILRICSERGVDLIVMGVSGRGAVDVAVFGSTTHRVLRGASCPVLAIRHLERAS